MSGQSNKLSTLINKPLTSFDELFNKDIEVFRFPIDCNELPKPNYETKSIDYVSSLVPIVKELKNIHKPCLYWFETATLEEANELFAILENFRENGKSEGRTIPAKNNYHKQKDYIPSKVMYVGKRHAGIRKYDKLTHIAGRIIIQIKRVFERGNELEKNEIKRFYGEASINNIITAND